MPQGAAGGDFNSIIAESDSKRNQQAKISLACCNLVNALSRSDSYRRLHPKINQFSRYQTNDADGATKIDRSYQWGPITAIESQYNSVSFSDHLSLRVAYALPHNLDRNLAPKSKPAYKIPPSVVQDETFKNRLKSSMKDWLRVKDAGAYLMIWWESMFKRGINPWQFNAAKN